jgi:flagellar hook-length control protein FliK
MPAMTATPALPASPNAAARGLDAAPSRPHGAPGRAADFAALLDGARAAAPAPRGDAADSTDGAGTVEAAAPNAAMPADGASTAVPTPVTTPAAAAAAAPAAADETGDSDALPERAGRRTAAPEWSQTASDRAAQAAQTTLDARAERTPRRVAAGHASDAQAEHRAPCDAQALVDDAPRQATTAPAAARTAADAASIAAPTRPAVTPVAEAVAPTLVAAAVDGTAASSVSTPAAAATALPEARLPHPLPSPAFAPALGRQVALWVRQGVPQALLQLNPAELGPVAVRITLDGTQAHVDFTALHAATRGALEASLPALAGALRDSGLTLAGGGVFDRPREQRDDGPAGDASPGRAGGHATVGSAVDATDALPGLGRRGLVDLVA